MAEEGAVKFFVKSDEYPLIRMISRKKGIDSVHTLVIFFRSIRV